MPARSIVTWSKGLQPRSRTLSHNIIFWSNNLSVGSQGSALLSGETGAALCGSPWERLWVGAQMILSLPTRWLCFLFTGCGKSDLAMKTPHFGASSANASLWIFSYFIYLFIRSFAFELVRCICSPLQEILWSGCAASRCQNGEFHNYWLLCSEGFPLVSDVLMVRSTLFQQRYE